MHRKQHSPEVRIGIFAISTFDTDYILTKEGDYENAIHALKEAGYLGQLQGLMRQKNEETENLYRRTRWFHRSLLRRPC